MVLKSFHQPQMGLTGLDDQQTWMDHVLLLDTRTAGTCCSPDKSCLELFSVRFYQSDA